MECALATHLWVFSSVDTPANFMKFLTFLTLTANKVSMHPFQKSFIATPFSASGMMESLVFPISPLYFLLF